MSNELNTVRFTVCVSPAVHRKLTALAKREGTKASSYTRRLIEQALRKPKKE